MRSAMPRGSASTRRRRRPYLPMGNRCPGGSGRMCESKWKAITPGCTNDDVGGMTLKDAAAQQITCKSLTPPYTRLHVALQQTSLRRDATRLFHLETQEIPPMLTAE